MCAVIHQSAAGVHLVCLAIGIEWNEADAKGEDDTKDPDGSDGLVSLQKKQRFGPDLRLMEV